MCEDEEALIASQLPLALILAKQWARMHPSANWHDTLSDAYLSTMLAVRSHDPSRTPLQAWVAWKVRRGFVDGVRQRWGDGPRRLQHPTEMDTLLHRETYLPSYSFDQVISDAGGQDGVLAELIAEPLSGDLGALERVEVRVDLRAASAGLPPREQRLLAGYFQDDRTLMELAVAEGLTEGRISQILKQVLTQMGRHYGVGGARPWLAQRGMPRLPDADAA